VEEIVSSLLALQPTNIRPYAMMKKSHSVIPVLITHVDFIN
jgi:hypothetical protein